MDPLYAAQKLDRVGCASLLGPRRLGTPTSRITAYAVRSAEELAIAYERAKYMQAIVAHHPSWGLVWAQIIPSNQRRPTHFVLFQIDDRILLKAVFCLEGFGAVDSLCDRLAQAVLNNIQWLGTIDDGGWRSLCCLLVAQDYLDCAGKMRSNT
jgi:hypothetical protein